MQICFQMAQNLAQRGHSVTVCTSDYAGRQYEFQDLPFEVKYFRSLPTRWKFYITPGLIPWAARHVREYDVIHMHNVRTFQNAVIAANARRARIPYIISPHGSLPYLGTLELFKKGFDQVAGRRLLSEAAILVAVSQYEIEQFISMGIAKEKIRLIPNGLDLAEFNNLPERGQLRLRLGIRPETKLVFFLGRIHQIKGLDFLLEGFQELQPSGYGFGPGHCRSG